MNLDSMVNGLSSQIENANEQTVARVISVRTSKLKTNDKNFYQLSDIDSLKESISVNGLLTPLTIKKDYTILSGHRRLKACSELGIEMVDCIIADVDNEIDEELLLISANSQRVKTQQEKYEEIVKLKSLYQKKKNEDPNFKGNINKMVAEDLGVGETTVKRASRDLRELNKEETPMQKKYKKLYKLINNLLKEDPNRDKEISELSKYIEIDDLLKYLEDYLEIYDE